MPSRSASPNGSIRLGWQTTWARATQVRDLVVSDATGDGHAGPALDGAAQRPVADERQRAGADPLEGVRQTHDVLPLDQRPDAEVRGRAVGRGLDAEPLQVDPTVDDLDLAAGFRDLRLELVAKVVGDGDDGCGAAHDVARGGPNAGEGADVPDVPPVRGHDERRAGGERGQQPGRDEEVRVDDVGPEAAGGAHCVAA